MLPLQACDTPQGRFFHTFQVALFQPKRLQNIFVTSKLTYFWSKISVILMIFLSEVTCILEFNIKYETKFFTTDLILFFF